MPATEPRHTHIRMEWLYPEVPQVGACGFLAALQFADSAFPVGGHAHSHGLEQFVREGLVRDLGEVTAALAEVVAGQVAPVDGVAVAWAWRHLAPDRAPARQVPGLARLDRLLLAHKLATEARLASLRTGRRLLQVASGFLDHAGLQAYAAAVAEGRAPGNHAVAFGAVSRAAGLGLEEAVLAFLHSFAVGWLSAAQRLLPLEPDEVQAALHRFRQELVAAAWRAVAGHPGEMAAATPLAEVMAMRHERAEVRLFAS